MQKNLLTRFGEAIDQHRQEQQTQALPPAEPTKRSRLGGILRWFLPNGGTLLLIAILIFTQNVWAGSALRNLAAESAASTGTVAYEGRLADSSGNPLTQTLNMSFRLYSAATGGAPLWTEQWTGSNGVQVSDGLFNVMLGSLTPIAQSVITGNSNLFLGITVGTDDEMTPRVQLGSGPFAVQALTVPDGSITKAKIADDVKLGVDGWERDESSTTNPVVQHQTGLLLQHGYAQHVVSSTDINTTYYDHYVPFPVPFKGGTVPTVSISLTGESASATDVPKGGATNGAGGTLGRLFVVTNAGFTLRSSGGYPERRQGFHWIAIGQK